MNTIQESEFDEFKAFVICWTRDEGFSVFTTSEGARELREMGWDVRDFVCNNMQSASTRRVAYVKAALKAGIPITPKAALQL